MLKRCRKQRPESPMVTLTRHACKYKVPKTEVHPHTFFFTYLKAANGDKDVLLGDLEAGAELGLEVGLIAVLPEAGHLPGTGHLHAQQHVRTLQP